MHRLGAVRAHGPQGWRGRRQASFQPVLNFLRPRLRLPASVAAARGPPEVTLTYAQSLDGCIAGRTSERELISGHESMVMTHHLRTMHDAILNPGRRRTGPKRAPWSSGAAPCWRRREADLVIYGAPNTSHLNGHNGTAREELNGHAPEATCLSSSCRMWIEAIESECDLQVYRTPKQGQEIVALIKGSVAGRHDVPVRVHSECFTGDVLGSKRCDCGPQLKGFLDILQKEVNGVLLYIRGDEGRGIGLVEKIRAYELQETGRRRWLVNEEAGGCEPEQGW
eukprot:g13253.t1